MTAAPALACGVLLVAAPRTLYALVAFLALAPVALGALLASVARAGRAGV